MQFLTQIKRLICTGTYFKAGFCVNFVLNIVGMYPIRIKHIPFYLAMLFAGVCFSLKTRAQANGKVIINEVMPNRNGGSCGLGNEFVELINLGPGPQNISCYVVATNQYTITLPSVVLKPGQLYVLSGVTNIPINCANDIAITADLNWNNCNGCASANLGSGAGFLPDGSNDKFPLLLMDPNLTIIDALHFNTVQAYTSNPITVQAGQAGCATKTFNLSTYSSISYETVTPNTGSGNSYARNVDGGCTWIKETAENGGETNTNTGETYAISATYSNTITCDVANQTFNASTLMTISPSTAFPVTYTYGYSTDSVFTATDTYTTLVDNTASTIPISGLQVGYYSVLLQPTSSGGCNEFRVNFQIVNPILAVTPNYSLNCPGGAATFEVSNADPSYYAMTYTRTYSVNSNFSTINGTASGSVANSTANPDISFSSLTKGFYRVELDPAYGCNKIIDFEVKDPILSVTKSYSLECSGGTATFEVANSSPATYFPITYTRVYSANSSTFSTIDATINGTINSHTSVPDISFTNLPKGYYKLIIDPASGCNDTTIFQVLEPVPNITTAYTLQCSGGTASFELTSTPLANYFPFTYTRTYSANSSTFATINGTLTGTVSTSAGSPDISFQNLPPGYYKMEILPPNGCLRTINFQVIDTLLRPVTPFTTTLYCAGGGGTSSTSLGSVRITFSNPPATFSNYLPIDYIYYNTASPTVAYTGTSTSTSDLYISGLQAGTYSLTLDPAVGCSTNDIPFTIGTCPTLTRSLKSFTGKNNGAKNEFKIEIDTDGILDKILLESSLDGSRFIEEADIPFQNKKGLQTIMFSSPVSEHIFFRLELHDMYSRLQQSAIIKILNQVGNIGVKTFPNPVSDYITLSKFATKDDALIVYIISAAGNLLYQDRFMIKTGNNKLKVSTKKLPKGQYILSIYKVSTGDRQSSTIIKY